MSQPGNLRRLTALLATLAAAVGLVAALIAFEPAPGGVLAVATCRAGTISARRSWNNWEIWEKRGFQRWPKPWARLRPGIARPATHVLWKEIQAWARQPAPASSPKLAALARQLARRVYSFDPAARAVAADLATEILRQGMDGRVVDRPAVLADCDFILRASAAAGRPLAADLQGQPPTAAVGADRAGGPRGSAGSRGRRPSEAIPPNDRSLSEENPLREPAALPSSAAAALPATPTHAPSPKVETPAAEAPLAAGRGTGDELDRARRRWIVMDTVDLMRGLQAVEPQTAAEARAELIRRGFSEVHLDLARRLFDPDPEVRKQLVRTLPELRLIDAMPWLLRLTRDDDADAPVAALTLLATTGDPTMLSPGAGDCPAGPRPGPCSERSSVSPAAGRRAKGARWRGRVGQALASASRSPTNSARSWRGFGRRGGLDPPYNSGRGSG